MTLRFHPRLTVVAGLGKLERESLIAELMGAMDGSRRGTQLEIVEDSGRRLAFLRDSLSDRDRVLEMHSARDITAQLEAEEGQLDFLARIGLTADSARAQTRLSASDVAALARSDSLIASLASVDQDALWAAAENVRQAEAHLTSQTGRTGVTATDAPLIEELEERHNAYERARNHHRMVRRYGIAVAAGSVVAGAPIAFASRWIALWLAVIAICTLVIAVVSRRRLAHAESAEREALTKAGAQSYLDFHLQRVNELLETDRTRKRLAEAAVAHRRALEVWEQLAGEIAVDWAVSARDRISAAASRLTHLRDLGFQVSPESVATVIDPAELAHALVAKLAELRHGAKGEALPLILDEPFAALDDSTKAWALDLIARSAGTPQVVFLTNDPEVAAWARKEALAGTMTIVEPIADSVANLA